MISFFIFFFLLIGLFLLIDVLQKKVFASVSWARKATHVLAGAVVMFFPTFLDINQIVLISSCFVVILLISRYKGILGLHQIKRKSWGEIIYPFSILVLALISLPANREAFYVGVLCLALADFAAELVGTAFPIKKIMIGNHQKSVGGFIGFFIVTCIIFSISFLPQNAHIGLILTASSLLGVIELLSVYGSDNFTVPIGAALLVMWCF